MTTRTVLLGFLLVTFSFAQPASAEIPGHNKSLDHRCSPGFEYSRKIAACGQATCPAGASRTYTLGCNCGEAWGRPFRTCTKGGLAMSCVAKGTPCPDENTCPRNAIRKNGKCEPALPASLRCEVRDLFERRLAGLQINSRGGGKTWRMKSDAGGRFTVRIADRAANKLSIYARANGRYGNSKLTIHRSNQPKKCLIRVWQAQDIPRYLRTEYGRLLRNACVPAWQARKLDSIHVRFTGKGSGALYQPASNTVQIGSMHLEWDEMGPELAHEYAHGIVDALIDPSKNVGGPHNNWTRIANQGIVGQPEELAFEEGLADFIALLLHRSRNQTYQADLEDGATYKQALRKYGARSGPRIEGVITAFLLEYYRPIIEGGRNGPERALGDLLATLQERDINRRTPVRTVRQFVRAAKSRDKDRKVRGQCGIDPRRLSNVEAVASQFGVQ